MAASEKVRDQDLELAREFARRLAEAIGDRSFQVVLYGSRARGAGDEESDLDLFVTLEEDDPEEQTKFRARQIACEMTLEHGILVSVFVADPAFLERHRGSSYLEAVKATAVPV